MKISWNWLNDYISCDKTPEEVGVILTSIGLEVESIEPIDSIKGGLSGLVIGEVIACEKHPNADKLRITEVNLGETWGVQKIVCGAPNVALGQKVVVATVGTKLFPTSGEPFEIKASKIRGEESHGMICAEDEIGLGESHDGIIVLPSDVAIGTLAKDYYHVTSDILIEIGLTPNRMDAMSHKGVARDLATALTYLNIPHEYRPEGTLFQSIKKNITHANVSLEVHTDKCPVYHGVVLCDIKNVASPDWMQNRLRTIDVKPQNILVDTTNYILHDLGQPLHAFDYAKVKGEKVIVREMTNKTDFVTLDDKKVMLQTDDIVVSNSEAPMCIAGVYGGKESGVTSETTSIFLECALFDSTQTRKTSNRLNLRTEAASKYEKGVDPDGLAMALIKALSILSQYASAVQSSEILFHNKLETKPAPIVLTKKKLDTYAGYSIDTSKISEILKGLEIEITSQTNEQWTLTIPRFKMDVTREEDVIEEILRISGYDQVPFPKKLNSNLSFSERFSALDFEDAIVDLLVGDGYADVMTNSISQSKYFKDKPIVRLLNSMTSELDCMRYNMLPGLLEVVGYNVNRDQKNLNLFEIGKKYAQDGDQYIEAKKIVLVKTGVKHDSDWIHPKSKSIDYFDLKRTVESLLRRYTSNVQFSIGEADHLSYAAHIMVNNQLIGYLGEVDSRFAKEFDIKQVVFFAEIDFYKLYQIAKSQKSTFKEISKFPSVKRDLALLVDQKVEYAAIESVCKKTLKQLLLHVQLFDVYEDASLQGKKSYAIRMTIQDALKTMTDVEIDTEMQRLIEALRKDVQAEIRQ